jgi:hypothetical protein
MQVMLRPLNLTLSLFIEGHKQPLSGTEIVTKNIKFVYLMTFQLSELTAVMIPICAEY